MSIEGREQFEPLKEEMKVSPTENIQDLQTGIEEPKSKENLKEAAELAGKQDDVRQDVDDLLATIRRMSASGREGSAYVWGRPGLEDMFTTRENPKHREVFEDEVLSQLGVDLAEVEKARAESHKYDNDMSAYKSQGGWGEEPEMPMVKTLPTNINGVEIEIVGGHPIVNIKAERPAGK